MKPNAIFLALWAATQLAAPAQVGIGTTTPDASAQLDISSTTLGLLPPRMTQAQREAIAKPDNKPAAGLLVYQTDGSPGLYIYDGSTGWSTFNGKVPATLTLSTSAPLTGGGTLAGDLTLAMPAATTAADGFLSSADWNTFNAKENTLSFSTPLSRSDNAISLAAASVSSNGYLSSADWTTFNAKESALTFSSQFSRSDNTITLATASGTSAGALSSADWTTFNGKENTLSFSTPFNRSDNTISLAAASVSSNGYLSSADWAHFNTAYGWGNHAAAGYLTSFTETDPLFAASAAHGIAADDITAWNAKVGGSGTANYVPAFTASGTLGNSALFSAATGNVGIGTTTPTAALNVLRTASTSVPALVIESSASLANNDIIRMQINGLTNGFRMFQDPSSNVIYSFERGNVGIGTTSPSLGLLQLTKTPGNDVNLVLEQSGVSTWDIRNSATSGNFGIYNGQLGTVSMAIDRASGNVGIGTTTPNELMSLVQSSTSDIGVGIYNSTPYSAGNVAGGYLNLGKYEAAGPAYVPMVQLVGYPVTQSNSSEGALAIKTRKNGALTTQVTILDTGNVGIGTTTPAAPLTVKGSIASPIARLFSAEGYGLQYVDFGQVGADFTMNSANLQNATPGSFTFNSTNNSTTFTRMFIDYNGNVGIGTTTPSRTLYVNGTSGGTNAWENLSDKRLKKDVQPIGDALAIVEALRGVTYNWDQTADPAMKLDARNHVGFIAQEVEQVLPQAVSTATDARQTKSVAYSEVIPVLTEAIKQQQSQIDALTDENDTLKAQNAAILQRLDALEAK